MRELFRKLLVVGVILQALHSLVISGLACSNENAFFDLSGLARSLGGVRFREIRSKITFWEWGSKNIAFPFSQRPRRPKQTAGSSVQKRRRIFEKSF